MEIDPDVGPGEPDVDRVMADELAAGRVRQAAEDGQVAAVRFERLEQEYQAILQALRRIESRLTEETGRREILERDLAQLRDRVAALQSRIDDLEQRLGR